MFFTVGFRYPFFPVSQLSLSIRIQVLQKLLLPGRSLPRKGIFLFGSSRFWRGNPWDPVFFKCCFFIFLKTTPTRRPSSLLPRVRVIPPLVLLLPTDLFRRHSSQWLSRTRSWHGKLTVTHKQHPPRKTDDDDHYPTGPSQE